MQLYRHFSEEKEWSALRSWSVSSVPRTSCLRTVVEGKFIPLRRYGSMSGSSRTNLMVDIYWPVLVLSDHTLRTDFVLSINALGSNLLHWQLSLWNILDVYLIVHWYNRKNSLATSQSRFRGKIWNEDVLTQWILLASVSKQGLDLSGVCKLLAFTLACVLLETAWIIMWLPAPYFSLMLLSLHCF